MTQKLFDEILLNTSGVSEEVSCRFAKLFCETWDSLPGGIRRISTLYWKTGQNSPCITLVPFEFINGQNTAGKMRSNGHAIDFNSEIFALVEKSLMKAVIVHEIAHIAFLALGQSYHVSWNNSEIHPPNRTYKIKIGTELLAKELTRRLKFRQDDIIEWLDCKLSTNEYSLRDNCEEKRCLEEFWMEQTKMEVKWANIYSNDGKSVEEAKDAFYEKHSDYFDLMLDNKQYSTWTDLTQVKSLITTES